MHPFRALPWILAVLFVGGCASRQGRPASSPEVVEMEEMRITARRAPDGSYEFTSYDAEGLFEEATALLNEGACEDAVAGYDRIAEEFAESVYVSPALYNAGLCLQRLEQPEASAARFEHLIRTRPDSPDGTHAHFQLAKLYVELERWEDAREAADALLAVEDLPPEERMEALARRSQALLGAGELEDAEGQAQTALGYYRSGAEEGVVRDTYFAAASNYVLAETRRQRAQAIEIPTGGIEAQRPVLEQRAQLVLDAQREYFNTIRYQVPKWAAAAGYRIGEMYDEFWHAILAAPVPPPRRELSEAQMPVYEEEYRKELQRFIKPLIRNAIRYWELTLMMVDRAGYDTDWADRIREDLDKARERLLEQPEDEPEGGAEADPPAT